MLPISPPFPGQDLLARRLDAALLADADPAAQVRAVEAVLRACIDDGRIRLPARVWEDPGAHYARRLLLHSPALGYSVIAMSWGPGHATPLHDHDDQWCAEGVWRGPLQVTPYAAGDGPEPGMCRLRPRTPLRLSTGQAGHLLPPDQYHVIANPSATGVAVSVHVYQRLMARCTVFEPVGGDLYRACARDLALTPWD